jgi:hypothetical protein
LQKAASEVKELVAQAKAKHPDRTSEDELRERQMELFRGKVGEPFSEKRFKEICQVGEKSLRRKYRQVMRIGV